MRYIVAHSQPYDGFTSQHSSLRVLPDIGLVICRYGKATILSTGGVCQGSRTYWAVSFELLVFCPFVGEILVGTLEHASPEGIRVSLGGFFDSVFVPAFWMLRPSVYDTKAGEWVWETEEDRYPMHLHSAIRVRVKSWQYTKRVATAKGLEETTKLSGRKRSSSIVEDEEGSVVPAMQITASICEDGLGLLEWWTGGDEEEEEEMETEIEQEQQTA